MSDEVIALVITIAIIALFFAWVPLLNLVCQPCARFLERRRLQKNIDKERSH
jgi:cytochrome c oxidase assembly protein Cox11